MATVCQRSRHPPKLPLQVKVQDWGLLFHCIGLSGHTAVRTTLLGFDPSPAYGDEWGGGEEGEL